MCRCHICLQTVCITKRVLHKSLAPWTSPIASKEDFWSAEYRWILLSHPSVDSTLDPLQWMKLSSTLIAWFVLKILRGAGVAQRLYNGLPRNDPGFDSRWGRCKNRASRPSQGTVNGGDVSKWPRCRWDVQNNHPTNKKYWLQYVYLMGCEYHCNVTRSRLIFV